MLHCYGNIKGAVAPAMTAYNSATMTIEHGQPGKRRQYVYTFEPKVGAGEGRKRLVGMHTESKQWMGIVSLAGVGWATSSWQGGVARASHLPPPLTLLD